MSPRFRLACCLCGKPVPLQGDAYVLDGEWKRRFPEMTGSIAYRKCALGNGWTCQERDGSYPPGHIAAGPGRADIDSWSHITGSGTHVWAVLADLGSGMAQGAEAYIRAAAIRPGVNAAERERIRAFVAAWDARPREAERSDD